MKIRNILYLCIALSCTAFSQNKNNAHTADRAPFLVTPQWLQRHLHDPNLVVIETGDSMDNSRGHRIDKTTGHIPGSQFMEMSDVSAPYDPEHKALALELPAVEALAKTLEAMGISDDSRIVLYTEQSSNSDTTRIFFALDYLGLGEHTSILDGGLPNWTKAGYKTSP